MANTPEPEHFYRAMADIGLPDDVRRHVMTSAFVLADEDAPELPIAHGLTEKREEVDEFLTRTALEAEVEADSDLADLLQKFTRELAELIGPR